MNLLILLSALFTTFPNPDGSYTTYSDMPPPQSPLSRDTRLADAYMVGAPTRWQPPAFSYDELDERYPVRTPARFQVPIEEQIATEQLQTERTRAELDIRQRAFNEQATRKDYEYQNRILAQAEQATGLLGQLNPQSADYIAQKAKYLERFPLAAQNPQFNSLLSRLDQTYGQWTNDQDALQRYNIAQSDRDLEYRQRQASEMRERVASLGTGALEAYNTVEKETSDPLQAYAAAATWAANAKREAAINAPLDRQDYIAFNRAQENLLKGEMGIARTYEQLSDAEKAEYQFLQSQKNAYIKQTGFQPPAPTPSATPQNLSQYEGKVIRQGGQAFRVTNGVPVPIK